MKKGPEGPWMQDGVDSGVRLAGSDQTICLGLSLFLACASEVANLLAGGIYHDPTATTIVLSCECRSDSALIVWRVQKLEV